MNIDPAEGYVAVEFLDDYDGDENEGVDRYDSTPAGSSPGAVCFAQCEGVGKDVKRCKRGDVVLVMEYERKNGIKISDSLILVSQWSVVGVVKNK